MIELKSKTIAGLCLASSAKYKNHPAFALYSDGKIIRKLTYAQMGKKARQIAVLLQEMGVKKGDRVLLLSENCPEWPCAYFGISLAGAVSVPLLTGFSPEQIQYIIEHSEAKVICTSWRSNDRQLNNFPLMQDPKDLTSGNNQSYNLPPIYIDKLPEPESDTSFDFSSFDYIEQNETELASIIYTSGTQGNSKGVMLSGLNLLSSAISSSVYVKVSTKDRMLSVLPLAHSYECSLGFLYPVMCGTSITYIDKPPSPSVLLPALKMVRPTAMLSVPLLIEKIYRASIKPKLEASKLHKFPLTKPIVIRAAGKKLIKALGGHLRFFGIGGAPLAPEVEEFLYHARFPYSVGYGLTEASPLVAGRAPLRFKLHSGLEEAGGVSMRVVDDEIQATGPNIMLGYYKDPEKTAETITSDGWLKTGDLGSIDEKGRLHIKGRLKALILGPSGENIYPEEIESLLGSSQLIEESLVYAGSKGEIVALVHLNEAAKAATDATMRALDDLKNWVNKKLAGFSRINKIEVKDEPFEKTPTMKIKRYLYK